MATYTENYNLKMPSGQDAPDVEDFNTNAEIIDTVLKAIRIIQRMSTAPTIPTKQENCESNTIPCGRQNKRYLSPNRGHLITGIRLRLRRNLVR